MLISKFDTRDIEINISKYEDAHNFLFPNLYRDFLLKYNGGDTPDTTFRINRISSDLEGFYGLGSANEFLNYKSLDDMGVIDEYINDNMLPIGRNSFGDIVTIALSGDNEGKIYFKYHDRPKKYIFIADDFKMFIGKCKSKKLGHIRTIEERKQCMIDNGLEDEITEDFIKDWQKEIDKYGNMRQEKLIL